MSRWKLMGPVAVVALGAALIGGGAWFGAGPDAPVGTSAALAGTPAATARPTSRPRLITPHPSFRLDPPPALAMPYFNDEGGYWFQAPGRWSLVGGTFGQGCVFDFCAAGVTVAYAPSRSGIDIAADDPEQDPIIIRGASLRKVRASWKSAFPDAEILPRPVDGTPGLLANAPAAHLLAVLVLRQGRLFMFSASTFWDGGGGQLLRQFLGGFHFMPAACWVEPCSDEGWYADPAPLLTFDADRIAGRWTARGASWSAGPGPRDRSVAGYWHGNCVDNLCQGYVSIAIGTATTGPVVSTELHDGRWSWIRASGTTLGAVAASAEDILGASTARRIVVDGVAAREISASGRVLVLLEHRGWFIAITAFDGFLARNASETMSAFLADLRVVP